MTQTLVSKIAALRQRLEKAQGLMKDADSAAAALFKKGDSQAALRRKVEAGERQQRELNTALKDLPAIARAAGDGDGLPAQLSARAARLLHRAEELLGQLRANAITANPPDSEPDPLESLNRETVSITDAVVRTIQLLPDSPTAQSRISEGLEAVLDYAARRIGLIAATRQLRKRELARQEELADILIALAGGHSVEMARLDAIAESVRETVADGSGLHFPEWPASDVPRHVAAHSLAVAEVIARLTRHDADWRNKAADPIAAALVHDVGMLKVPAPVLTQEQPLSDDQRRLIESHTLLGAELAAQVRPTAGWLVEAAGQHHERLDGTGYPSGLAGLQIKPLVRLLSVCDSYAAMCQPRGYRPAREPRTALTDTLLLAESGALDPPLAEKLLLLSFYPVGTAVELSDGTVGIVVATHQGRRDLNSPARPVVSLMVDAQGQPFPVPRCVDLADALDRSIVRALLGAERRERLGRCHAHAA